MIITPDNPSGKEPDPIQFPNQHPGGDLVFPLVADKNAVFDSNRVPIAIIAPNIPPDDAERLAKLFSISAELLQLIVVCNSLLTDLAQQSNLPHGTDKETDKEKLQCPLCQIESVVSRLRE